MPWLFLPWGVVTALSLGYGLLLPPEGAGVLATGGMTLAAGTILVVVPPLYGRLDPLRRRQLKWILWGLMCAVVPVFMAAVLMTWEIRYTPLFMSSANRRPSSAPTNTLPLTKAMPRLTTPQQALRAYWPSAWVSCIHTSSPVRASTA